MSGDNEALVDFLIIGAGKSGTTSLYYYLGQHPDICLSAVKEPRFFMLPGLEINTTAEERADFLSDFPSAPTTWRDYRRLFRDARPGQVRGEASIQYLSSEVAATNIGTHVPSAKLICILRNPIERAFSNYLHTVRDKLEPYGSILEALEAEGAGHYYFDGGYYARQIESYATRAPSNPLRIWLYDDFNEDPLGVVREIFEYLAVDDDFTPDMSFRANVSGDAGDNVWARFYDWVRKHRWKQSRLAQRVIPLDVKQRVVKVLASKADASRSRPRMTEQEWDTLYEVYREEIDRLETLLDRDLDRWRRYPESELTSS